jgi:hypothetical protein
MITKELALEYFKYADGKLFWKKTDTNRCKIGDEVGFFDELGYRKVNFKYRKEAVHRLIFLMHYGYLPREIDHADGNPSNNRIENLRAASINENRQNTKLRKDNSSGLKGITWDKSRNKWLVRVNCNKKTVYQGRFDDLELAELVAIEARDKYHKEFAR